MYARARVCVCVMCVSIYGLHQILCNVLINQWPQWVPTTFSGKMSYSSLWGLPTRMLNISQQAQNRKPSGVTSSDGVDLRPHKICTVDCTFVGHLY